MKKVLILGGGFAGVQAAIEFDKSIFDVTLISDRDYFFLYPISIWIPTNQISFDNVKVNLDKIGNQHNFKVAIDKIESVNSKENKVIAQSQEYQYDYLITAIGAGKVKHTGIENTLSICGSPETSLDIKQRFIELVEKGKGSIAVGFGGNPMDPSGVRGGPAYEMIFNFHDYLKKNKLIENFELSFFAPMPNPGSRMGKKSSQVANKMLDNLKIKKYFGKKITSFGNGEVNFEDQSKLKSDLIIFIPASSGHPVYVNSDLSLTPSGFVKIDDTCLVENTTNVYAAGDTAAIEGFDWIAKQGHLAEVMAKIAVRNITAKENSSEKREGYKKHLNIICIMDTGNGAAFIYRDENKSFLLPLPVIGHYLKRVWGVYSKLTKTTRFPKIPGL